MFIISFKCKRYKEPYPNFSRCKAYCIYSINSKIVKEEYAKHNHPNECEAIKRLRTINTIKQQIKQSEFPNEKRALKGENKINEEEEEKEKQSVEKIKQELQNLKIELHIKNKKLQK